MPSASAEQGASRPRSAASVRIMPRTCAAGRAQVAQQAELATTVQHQRRAANSPRQAWRPRWPRLRAPR